MNLNEKPDYKWWIYKQVTNKGVDTTWSLEINRFEGSMGFDDSTSKVHGHKNILCVFIVDCILRT